MGSPGFFEKLNLFLRMRTIQWFSPLMSVPEPEKWVFIVGCYNSGTTLLHRLLSRHPMVGSMPNEGQFFSSQLPRAAQFGIPRLWALKPEFFYLKEDSPAPIDPKRLKREWAWMYNDRKRPVLIEKTIAHSARMRWLQKHFAPASFIILVRNGYAVAEGIHRKEGHELKIAARQWAVSQRILDEDSAFLQNCTKIGYEDLCDDPESTMRAICSFLGLPDLDSEVFKQDFTVHRQVGKIKNQNAASLSRLSEAEFEIIEKEAGDVLKKYGYSRW